MSTFKITVFALFFLFIIISVLLFTGVIPGFRSSSGGTGGEVVLWGTVPQENIRSIFEDINREYEDSFRLTYVQKDEEEYESDLVQALAAGSGPDLFFLPHDLIVKHQDKVQPISYESVTERRFRDGFLEQGELFLTEDGILAFPFIVDPLVMYWNRNLFSQAGIAQPPKYWDELFTMVPKLTKTDAAGNVTQSAVPFGTFPNVRNAKPTLSTLILQTQNPIIERSDEGAFRAVLASQEQRGRAESALRFYTQFANPSNQLYTWNPSLDEARNAFIAEDLAIYIGFASELSGIITQNPHLNVDVAMVPQVRDQNNTNVFGNVTGLAISKQSDNARTAMQVMSVLTNEQTLTELSKSLRLPPVRRDMLSQEPTDAYQATFYDAAIASTGWLDPNPERTYTIFRDAVSGITSGRVLVGEAILDAQAQLEALLR